MNSIVQMTSEELERTLPYSTPALTVHGYVSDLTAGGSTGDKEGSLGPNPRRL